MAFDLDVVFARKVVFVTGVVLPRVFILIADIKIGKTISTYAVALQLIFYILMLWAGVPVYIEMLITLLLLREERATEDHGRPVFQADPLLRDEAYGFTSYPRRRSNVRTQRHA